MQIMVGGYRTVDDKTLLARQQNDQNLMKVEKAARDAYRAKNNGELGNLIKVSEQVVAGINYKMVFQTENGDYEVVVFNQPWTQTIQVTEMKPIVEDK